MQGNQLLNILLLYPVNAEFVLVYATYPENHWQISLVSPPGTGNRRINASPCLE